MKKLFKILGFFLMISCKEKVDSHVINQPKLISNSQEPDTAALATSANLYFRTKQYEQAFTEYSKLIEVDSMSGRNYFRRGYCLVQLDRFHEAIPDYEKSASLDFKRFDSYYSIGLIYAGIPNDTLAIKYFKKCILINPKSKQVRFYLESLSEKLEYDSVL